jgi:D-serine deaminase-like pyridoxal phosphate-dependent protein
MEVLRIAAGEVGGEIVSAGGTGNHDVHAANRADTGVTEVQAGSYALMDTYYSTLGLPFRQAVSILGTVISTHEKWVVADVGLKSLGMDHGNPSIAGHKVPQPVVGSRVRVIPAHVDPTMAMHDSLYLVRGDDVLDRLPIDLRGW